MNKKKKPGPGISKTATSLPALKGGLLSVSFIIICVALITSGSVINSGCGIYKFTDATFPDSIKTVRVKLFENRATYINVQLAPKLSDKLRQKFVSQTKLTQTNNDNADWVIDGTITTYSFSTSGIAQKQVASNRLTVGVHVTLNDQKSNKTTEYDVSRSFDFSANQTIQQAEAGLTEEMVRGLTDDIFNRMFSTW